MKDSCLRVTDISAFRKVVPRTTPHLPIPKRGQCKQGQAILTL